MKTESPNPVPETPVARRAAIDDYDPPKRSDRANILYEKGLFTLERNYLVGRGGRYRVSYDYLEDRTVVLMCLWLPDLSCEPDLSFRFRDLKQVYSETFSGSVEFVLAVCMVHEFSDDDDDKHIHADENAFKEFLGSLPFLAIPLKDRDARLKVCLSTGITPLEDILSNSMQFTCAALDMAGNWSDFEPSLLFNYGTDCYPFTEDRLAYLENDLYLMRILQVDHSITSILDCPSDDTTNLGLTKLDGTPVDLSPSDLCKGAGVFYLYGDGSLFEMLHQTYEDCKSQKLDLIVVLVYTPFKRDIDKGSYVKQVNEAMAEFTQDDLYVLPLENDKLSRKLSWFFSCGHYTSPPDLLINWGPDDKCVDLDGDFLINYYGLAAYPFTKVGFKASLMRKYEKLQLEDFLLSAKITDVAGREIALSQLKETKTIVLHISEEAYSFDPNEVIENSLLAGMYDKDPPGGYEFIFLCLGGETHGDVEAFHTAMPWLIAQFENAADVEKLCKMRFELCYRDYAYITIHNGKVVSQDAATVLSSTLFSSENDLVLPTDCTLVLEELTEVLEDLHMQHYLM